MSAVWRCYSFSLCKARRYAVNCYWINNTYMRR